MPLPSSAADDVLARVRARGLVQCGGIVRPGLAVPSLDGSHWYGLAVEICRAVAAAVLGDPGRSTFRPYTGGEASAGARTEADDVDFVSGAELVRDAHGAATLQLGPVVLHDALALLVPAVGARHAADLAGQSVCVEPGSAADRALTRYFERHGLALHEHPFQETDEMRQAYGDGKCDALAGPLLTLASVRADPKDGHPSDRILPEILADDPIFAATGPDGRWAHIVWWTFGVLVAAEDAGRAAVPANEAPVPGIPPAAGSELGLPARWASAALAAGGDYGELYDRTLGARSRFGLARGPNALWRDGGLIFGLSVE